jgi:nucleotide-binding universal stress UspA family protein
MKILIAVSSKEFSTPTLNMGMRVAKAFGAKATIVDVGEKINPFSLKEVGIARERMDSWDIDRPGVDVLEWAFEFLAQNKFIERNEIESGFPKNTLIERDGRRSEVFLKGTVCDDVSLILRNGEIIEELIDEVQTEGYDVTIIGKSKNSKKDYELSQFIDSSIFIVNNNGFNQNYKILLPVDDSPGMKKAVKYSARIAQAFKIGIDLITVSKSNKIHQKNKQALTWAEKFLRRCNIDFKSTLEKGETVEAITRKAGANHIIIMGSSSSGALKTFIAGSKPLRVLKNSNSPILIVK